MTDYIDREHLIKSFCAHCIESGVDGKQCKEDCTDIVIIKNQRIADVRKNVHGEWIRTEIDVWMSDGKKKEIPVYTDVCSICNTVGTRELYNFCPNCGAQMS